MNVNAAFLADYFRTEEVVNSVKSQSGIFNSNVGITCIQFQFPLSVCFYSTAERE